MKKKLLMTIIIIILSIHLSLYKNIFIYCQYNNIFYNNNVALYRFTGKLFLTV